MQKVTLYTVNDLFGNVVKREIKMTSLEYKNYAQYENLLHVQGIPKGKRKEYLWRSQGRHAFFIVVEGWGHPEPDSMFGESRVENGLTFSESRYLSHSPEYLKDFMKAHWDGLRNFVIKYDIDSEYLTA